MSKFIVTGATGFVGSNLAHDLTSSGHEVIYVGRSNEQPSPLPCISYTFHDLNWSEIGPVDGVFHQAALTNTLHKPETDFDLVNFQQSKTLFESAAKQGCTFIAYASSCAVYGNVPAPFKEDCEKRPLNAYGQSKLELDNWAMEWAKREHVRVIGLRYSNVYGPGESHKGNSASMVYQLLQQVMNGNRPRLFEWGTQKRDYVHISDVIQANRLAMVAPSGIYNVGSGEGREFNDLACLVQTIIGIDVKGPKFLEPEYFTTETSVLCQTNTQCDLTLSRERLGYKPKFMLEEGVKDYYQSLTKSC